MVFETIVADLINRYLGDFVENLDQSQLKLGLWGGKLRPPTHPATDAVTCVVFTKLFAALAASFFFGARICFNYPVLWVRGKGQG